MNFNFLYDIASGDLRGESGADIDIPAGMAVKVLPQSDNAGLWNSSTLSFDARPVSKLESRLDFIDRFTDSEMELIMNSRRTNDKIAVFIQKLDLADEVDRDSSRTTNAVNGLEAIGLIGVGRAAEILA